MKNNKVFIICDTVSKRWQMRCANAERHVESRAFPISINHDDWMMLTAVSPRRELDGTESNKEKFKVLKNAMKGCRYVYAAIGWESDPMCLRLARAARWRFKTFIFEEDE